MAIATAIFVLMELRMLQARTPQEEYRHDQVGGTCPCGSAHLARRLRADVLKAGRGGSRGASLFSATISLVLNFRTGQNLNFLEVSDLERSPSWESPSLLPGTRNPWMAMGQVSVCVLVIFPWWTLSITARRRGERSGVLSIVASATFFVAAGIAQPIWRSGASCNRPSPSACSSWLSSWSRLMT